MLIDFLQRKDVKQFIQDHVDQDVNRLILNPPTEFRENIREIASQISSRQKAKGKLDAWFSNFDLIMPPPLSVEQASSGVTCDYKKSLVSGDSLVDLTGGMGIDFLALSSSFRKATYVERSSDLCNVFKHNAGVLSGDFEIVNEEAQAFLSQLNTPEKPFIYLDPARRDAEKNKVFKIEDCSPDLTELFPLLKEKSSGVLVKYSPLLDIQSILNSISHVEKIHVVSVRNDCKELLLQINFSFEGEPVIKCVNLQSNQPAYSFKPSQEKSSPADLTDIDNFILEPNSSIMKAGAFKKIAADFNLGKLGEHTHLYTSPNKVSDFPGRTFKVIESADKKSIRKFAPGGKINVISRNHPLDPKGLKHKWKLRDGGDYFLIAFRDKNGKSKMVISERTDLSG